MTELNPTFDDFLPGAALYRRLGGKPGISRIRSDRDIADRGEQLGRGRRSVHLVVCTIFHNAWKVDPP
jgi:hypothetical protein